MKIVDVRPLILANEPPYRGGRYWMLIEVVTDQGLVGLGERILGHTLVADEYTPDLADVKPHVVQLEQMARRFVIGENPFDVERIWQRVFGARHDFRHPSLDSTPMLSAIEMACWDIIGKATGQPVYNLLGGRYHDRLRAYAYLPDHGVVCDDPPRAGEIAVQLVEAGNTACKLDPFTPLFPLPRDIPLRDINRAAAVFRAMREAVGDALEIGLGTHGQLTTYSAIRVAHVLEEFHPFWFEEPVAPENVDEMARVAAHTTIPIATGERLVTKYEFREVLEKQAAQIIQMDVGQCGGILEAKKIAAMAESHYAMIAPHMACGPIVAAAAVQVATCSPNFLILENNGGALHREILKEPIAFERGYITPPTAPGLGVELDPEVVERLRVEL